MTILVFCTVYILWWTRFARYISLLLITRLWFFGDILDTKASGVSETADRGFVALFDQVQMPCWMFSVRIVSALVH